MPQIQSGQVKPGQDGAPQLYGTQKQENTIPFQEKMMRLFKPQEFVTIKNIDDEPVYWQYMPIDNEQETYSEDGLQKQINRLDPEMWMIEAGQTEVLVGASAYRALDVMYKNVTSKKTLRKFKNPGEQIYDDNGNHVPRNFNFADGGAQDLFLEQAVLGKAVPDWGNQAPQQVQPIAPAQPTVATSQTNPQVQPMAEQTAPIQQDDAPKPKTTEGAPLAPVTYADPDAPDPMNAAKNLVGANEPAK